MSQQLLTNEVITNTLAWNFKNNLVFGNSVVREYDDQFAKAGAKIGNVLNIRTPQIFESKTGRVAQIQDIQNKSVALEITHQEHVAFQFTSADRALSVDKAKEMYLDPASAALANKVDFVGLQLARKIPNIVGTYGTTPSTLKTALLAKARIFQGAAPKDDQLSLIIDSMAEAEMVDALKGLFQSSEQIKNQYEKGVMGKTAGFNWKASQNVDSGYEAGTAAGAPVVDGTGSLTGSTISFKGLTASQEGVFKAGDVISFEDVYAVNPLTKISTGQPAFFVVTEDADSDGAGKANVKIYPELIAEGNYRNVTAAPVNDAEVELFLGQTTTGKVLTSNLAFHKNAFALGMADLDIPGGTDKGHRVSDKDLGISLRFITDYDIKEDVWVSRVDVLFGWAILNPLWACRIMG